MVQIPRAKTLKQKYLESQAIPTQDFQIAGEKELVPQIAYNPFTEGKIKTPNVLSIDQGVDQITATDPIVTEEPKTIKEAIVKQDIAKDTGGGEEAPEEKKGGGFDLGGIGKTLMGGLSTLASQPEDLAKIAAGLAAQGYGGDGTPNIGVAEGYLDEAAGLREERMAGEERQSALDQLNKKLAAKQKADSEKDAQGKILPANQATELGDQSTSLIMLDDMIDQTASMPDNLFDPITGKMAAWNPYSKEGQAFAQLGATTKQVIGKGLEGGVLRKEDEQKYEKIIPKIGDTREILTKKANQLRKMLATKRTETLGALGKAGYNVSNFSPTSSRTYSVPTKKAAAETKKPTPSKLSPEQKETSKALKSKYNLE